MYGGFWNRVAATIIDLLIIGAGESLLFMILGERHGSPSNIYNEGNKVWLNLKYYNYNDLYIVINWLYFALFESSIYQATPGKLILGLKVVDVSGEKITFARATGRFFAKILSAITLLLGYIMVAFSKTKQGLHDKIAGTMVLKNN